MNKKVDVLVIGGSAAGIVAAITGKAFYGAKSVLIVRKEAEAVVPCGIPYIFNTLKGVEQNIIPNAPLEQAGVELMIDEVVAVNKAEKSAQTANGTVIAYDKLVFATGSLPKLPTWFYTANLKAKKP
jgi:NADPH-dependent 2,4-dienoyl-CoA reductase/sulfur reductase-like enzyme